MQPGAFWDMTPAQLLTLADQHQAAHQSGGDRSQPTTGPGLMEMALM
ncbi:hypothetical protein ACFWP5_32380 [Streptomyces sp. NPDC058469]